MTGYIQLYSGAEVNEQELSDFATDFVSQPGVIRQNGVLGFLAEELSPLNGRKINITTGGKAYVLNDSYAANGTNPKYWLTRFSGAIEELSFAANSSGSTRIDLICIKVDTTVPSANPDNTGVASLVVVQGNPGAGVPATPANHLALWQVTCANGYTQLTNANLTDVRTEAVLYIPDGGVDTTQIADAAVTKDKVDFGSGIWWEEIGRTTLSVAGDTITVDNLPARKYLRVMFSLIPTGGTINARLTFNNDKGGTSYALNRSVDFGSISNATSQAFIQLHASTAANLLFGTFDVLNIQNQEKMVINLTAQSGAAGAGNAPSNMHSINKWANTANQITRIDLDNAGTGDYAIGSEVIVLGHD